jgi:GH15 family glucan-1,4-alpha-glucosidase
MLRNLDLALIGNGAIGLLVDSLGAVVWGCFPRFDGDATFCALLDGAPPGEERGVYAVEIIDAVDEIGRRFVEETIKYWHDWVRRLAIPFEWQAAVIRAAITLQQNPYDDTGAIVAAMTTSIPETAGAQFPAGQRMQ